MSDVSRETQQRLQTFAELLTRWNQKINLVSRSDLAQLWPRHIDDSLQMAPMIPMGSRVIDLGSGGGFPGLVIAIARNLDITLIESDQRKAAFLREAARVCDIRAQIVAMRIEQAKVPPAPFVTARALAALPQLLAWAYPFLSEGGRCLFLKGRSWRDELTAASSHWHMTATPTPSRTDAQAVILALHDLSMKDHLTDGA